MSGILTEPQLERRIKRLTKLIQGPSKPGRKPKEKAAVVKPSRALLPTYDGKRYATLAGGTVIQIDPQDVPLLSFGGWRYDRRQGVFCQKQVARQRKRFCLPALILQKAGRRRQSGGPGYAVYVNGDKTDLRRANLKWTGTKTSCPFDAARLHGLYWGEGKTLNQIAALAAGQIGVERLPHETVRRWLKRAGVPLSGGRHNAPVHQGKPNQLFGAE